MDKTLLQNIDAKLYEVGGWIIVEPDNAVWERGEMIVYPCLGQRKE